MDKAQSSERKIGKRETADGKRTMGNGLEFKIRNLK